MRSGRVTCSRRCHSSSRGRPWTERRLLSCNARTNWTAIITRSITPAGEALAGKHPLAATLVLRAMIDFSLRNARSSRYRHAARHLLDCSGLSAAIEDFGLFEPHDVYEARLRREHCRKISFWPLMD
jgi:uncharacterized protein DUF6880